MPTITLPDGKTKSFDKPVTGLEVAQSIGPGLAKAALAIKIDGETRDLSTLKAWAVAGNIASRTNGLSMRKSRSAVNR